MTEKWLDEDESVIIDGKSFVWWKTSMQLKGTWALLYLTNKRLYVKDRLTRMKLVEFFYDDIDSLEQDDKYLIVVGRLGGKKNELKIKLKNIDEMWESMIRQRMD